MQISVGRFCAASSIALGFACALATTPVAAASDTTFTACINGGNGGMRLVPVTQSCHHSETRVAWPFVGPQGPQGPVGPAGPTGATGPAGPAGASGTRYEWRGRSGRGRRSDGP